MNAIVTEPGFYPNVTPEQYFAEPCPEPALTNSGITILTNECPAKFAYAHPAIGQPPEETRKSSALYRGALVHRLALGKGAEYALSPYDAYRSNEAKEWRDQTEAAGLIPVKEAEFEQAEAMAERLRKRIADHLDGAEYQTEVVVAWQENGLWCRAMLDIWCPDLMLALDLKTCRGANDDAIDRAFANGYGRQDAWYRRGIGAATGDPGRARFGFLFVESDAPHVGRFAESSEHMRFGSEGECLRALETFERCMKSGEWPEYAPRKVQPTTWLSRQWEDAAIEEYAA